MAENTKIEWANHTFNPWIGCTKVGPGCDNCYAEADFDKRRHVVSWGAGQPRKRTAASTWALPARWNAEAERLGVRYRVFCASLADVFDNEVPVQWRRDLFDLIAATPHLDWLLVTKRIGNARRLYGEAYLDSARAWPENVWIGATVTNQAEADRDIPKLLEVPARVRFLSMEPLLGPVELNGHEHTLAPGLGEGIDWLTGNTSQYSDIFGGSAMPWLDRDWKSFPEDYEEPRIHWVIVGGESGPNARPMHPDWARSLRDQCVAAGVPFLFKQWGEWIPEGQTLSEPARLDPYRRRWCDIEDGDDRYTQTGVAVHPVGKKAAGRLLDGMQHDGYPTP